MNRREHVMIGALLFILYFLFLNLFRTFSADVVVFSAFAVAVASILPDVIEPAKNWRHRGYAHSKRLLKKTAYFFFMTVPICLLLPHALIVSSACLGYAAHLLADATTKAGLPP